MYESFYIGISTLMALLVLVLAKFLPRLLKFMKLSEQTVNVTQAFMLAYGIIFGIVNPITILAVYGAHYVLPW